MAKHTITRIYNDGVATFTDAESPTYRADLPAIDEPIGALAANFQVTFSFTKTKLKSIMLYATAAMIVYTNSPSGSAPQDTIHLAAGVMYLWNIDNGPPYQANPFIGDVTTIYVTSTPGGVLSIRGTFDPAT